jgi:hypothetical protein
MLHGCFIVSALNMAFLCTYSIMFVGKIRTMSVIDLKCSVQNILFKLWMQFHILIEYLNCYYSPFFNDTLYL